MKFGSISDQYGVCPDLLWLPLVHSEQLSMMVGHQKQIYHIQTPSLHVHNYDINICKKYLLRVKSCTTVKHNTNHVENQGSYACILYILPSLLGLAG